MVHAIRSVAGEDVVSRADLFRALDGKRPGEIVAVEVERDGQPVRLSVRLSAVE